MARDRKREKRRWLDARNVTNHQVMHIAAPRLRNSALTGEPRKMAPAPCFRFSSLSVDLLNQGPIHKRIEIFVQCAVPAPTTVLPTALLSSNTRRERKARDCCAAPATLSLRPGCWPSIRPSPGLCVQPAALPLETPSFLRSRYRPMSPRSRSRSRPRSRMHSPAQAIHSFPSRQSQRTRRR